MVEKRIHVIVTISEPSRLPIVGGAFLPNIIPVIPNEKAIAADIKKSKVVCSR